MADFVGISASNNGISAFSHNSTISPKSVTGRQESYRDMVNRHKMEAKEIDESIKALLKGSKKADKAQVEARAVQMRFDLRAKHQEEEDSITEPTGESKLLLTVSYFIDCIPLSSRPIIF